MAISYEQMPERFQREAIQIFADQLNGKISNTEAEKKARANEAAAQQAVAAGATGGSFLTTPPASTGGGPGTSRPGGTATVKRDCPVGYIWDEGRQECVPDPNKGIGLPSIETKTDAMEDLTDTTTGLTRAEQGESARAIINNLLSEYGLSNLTDFVNDLITKEDIISGDIILGKIRQTQQYKTRFAGNIARRNAGFNVLSEAEYIQMENS